LFFALSPHTDDLDGLHIIEDLADHSMLDIDPPGPSAGEISNQLLIRGRAAKTFQTRTFIVLEKV